jgi:CelD/BcsL family acetyltransferase involved in cellulose biosynthesis
MTVLDVIPLAAADLGRWEPAWRALEARVPDAAPFLCFDWLAAWAAVYAPRRLAVVRAGDALGLLEVGTGGRWRFAGRPVTSTRGLLGAGAEEWSAFGGWLRAHARRWATLDAEGVPPRALPWASSTPSETPVLDLAGGVPDRTRYRRILRRVEREGAVLREAADVPAALADFVRLHHARAASKGERHPQVDERLARMLGRLPASQLRVLELARGGRRLGVWLGLERGSTAWYYNLGIDPDALALAPGIALQLESIRVAIAGGRRRLDLGPGAHPYKLELGGVVDDRVDANAVSPSARGRAVDGLDRLERGARAVARRVRDR